MSTCISRHGEYGSHLPGEDRFICDRCFVFDEDAAMAALGATESQLAAAQAESATLRTRLATSQAEASSAPALRDSAQRRAAAAVEECDRALRELGLLRANRTATVDQLLTELEAAEARLEAVREWAYGGHGGTVRPVDVWPKLAAALSAAPQPEPDSAEFWAYRCGECRSAATCDAQRSCLDGLSPIDPPPASDEPARCEHDFHATNLAGERIGWRLAGAGSSERCPAASGTPGGGA